MIVLVDLDLEIGKGEIFGVIGYFGVGKSILICCINLFERLIFGEVWVDGVNLIGFYKIEL